MIRILGLTLFGVLALSTHLSAENNGQDVTRPVTRFDIRFQGQNGVGKQNGRTGTLTLRADTTYHLGNEWQVAVRLDAPFQTFNCPCHSSRANCYNSNHMDDSLAQCFIITPNYGRWCYAIGAKMIFPTAGKNLEIGNGKFQLLPSVAFRRDLDELTPGSYFGVIFRHDWSVGGYSCAKRISETYFHPFLNINLPCHWFLNSSPELFYDWLTHKWFIPLDLMIGKMITPKLVVSLEYEYGVVCGYRSYRNQIEFRIGLFF